MVSSYVGRLGERYSDQLDELGRRYVHYAVDGAERMRGLIDALLEYSASDEPSPNAPLPIDGLVDQVQRTLRSRIQSRRPSGRGQPATVAADEILIRQLVRNTLANALKFRHPERRPENPRLGPAPGWDVAVRRRRQRHRDRALLRPGLRDLPPAPPGGRIPGAGIGLAICQRIVATTVAASGSDSPLGGTRVLFTLRHPSTKGPMPETATLTRSRSSSSRTTPGMWTSPSRRSRKDASPTGLVTIGDGEAARLSAQFPYRRRRPPRFDPPRPQPAEEGRP